jgi:hypothetical protein
MLYLNDLIEALRAELKEQGEMLARFDDAEAQLLRDKPVAVLAETARLQEQENVVELTLRRRHRIQGKLACRLGLPKAAALADIISLLPRTHQPLVGALEEENTELSARVQQRRLPWRSVPLAAKCLVAA